MKWTISILFLTIIASCKNFNQKSFDVDVFCNKDTIISISPPEFTYKASIKVIHSCNSGLIGLANSNDSIYKYFKVDTTGLVFKGDWYNNLMKIKYIPERATSGQIEMEIIFYF